MMRLAIVHYHLKRGGVTRVIEAAIRSLRRADPSLKCVVIAAQVPESFAFPECAVVLPGLDYSDLQASPPDAAVLHARLQQAADEALGGPPDVWHIHNHSLGKNRALPGLVRRLAAGGAALLLQVHDFAEDGRPANHRLNRSTGRDYAYGFPLGPHIRYAVLNHRDGARLRLAGVPEAQVEVLENPVGEPVADQRAGPAPPSPRFAPGRLLLYPVRALRRKNLLEFFLWSTRARTGDRFVTTLGPTNPAFDPFHRHFEALASELELPVSLAVAERGLARYEDLLRESHSVFTTSVAEGFGMAFLEPWLAGKPVVGRDLPAITQDFKARGLDLDGLYPYIEVPVAWIDAAAFRQILHDKLTETYRAYGCPLPEDAVERAEAAARCRPGGNYDFGALDESTQERVLRRAVREPDALKLDLETMLARAGGPALARNAGLVQCHYHENRYGERLLQILDDLASTRERPLDHLDPAAILAAFLRPESFHLLRT